MTMTLREDVERKLQTVVDPETGIDVINMNLIENLDVGEDGNVSLTFVPSSPFCPLGIQLAFAIKEAVKAVAGVTAVTVKVDNHIQADAINKMLEQS
ncbi:MAG TPA: metal-sulfur cluster assembly factor [Thermoplasmata archaeon]|nr:metal-sulfur cluster assembly factor [Thermoplasmata archaeon]